MLILFLKQSYRRVKQPDPTKLKRLPQMFSSFAFTHRLGFDNEERRSALATPYTITVWLFDGTRYKIEVGKLTHKDEEKYFIQIDGKHDDIENTRLATLNAMMQKFSFVISPHNGRRLMEADFIKVAKN